MHQSHLLNIEACDALVVTLEAFSLPGGEDQ
jgi:hypothetical protein